MGGGACRGVVVERVRHGRAQGYGGGGGREWQWQQQARVRMGCRMT
jgi:hypothetical protein